MGLAAGDVPQSRRSPPFEAPSIDQLKQTDLFCTCRTTSLAPCCLNEPDILAVTRRCARAGARAPAGGVCGPDCVEDRRGLVCGLCWVMGC